MGKLVQIFLLFYNVNFQGYLYPNRSGSGALLKLLDNETDILLGDFFLKLDRLVFFDSSVSYFESPFGFVIPQPSKLSSFEKLAQPFEAAVWLALIFCVSSGVVVIFIINSCSKNLKIIVIGTSSPISNLFLILLGYSQPSTPKTNFARFILMLFIIFSLVMRSIYQGSLYNFLQSERSDIEIKSFDEMVTKNFKFMIGKSNMQLIEQTNLHPR